ncbi:NF-kappa-B inhibitor cactus [Venturia canescens]|uniref:NF-kappa-B inhibitor cactus n=1 Tax=Venturia canescens TaxID=32260 RepID=UPI001C9D500F|nr:NF-kappa-B inhibitor cactus [Venturia canescens]
MWQQSSNEGTTKGVVSSVEESYGKDSSAQQDSGIVDSGFLSSGGNLLTSEFGIEEDEARTSNESGNQQKGISTSFEDKPPSEDQRGKNSAATDPMRVDSGLDLGLSESLSQLSLKQINLNRFEHTKVQSEPTVELRPVVKNSNLQDRDSIQPQSTTQGPQGYSQEPWELYYMQDEDGDTQLHIAIVQGFLEAAFSLIRMAPHPLLLNILNDDCQAPLHLAVLTRQSRIARRLILAGANPSIRDFRGNTALHLACYSGDLACARALTDPLSPVERNYLANSPRIPALPQNLEQRNYDGEMCLHVAAAGGQVDIVQHLLRLGADLEAREGLSGRTALHLALERGCRSVVTFLLQECRPCLDAPTYAGITAYQIAICLDAQVARELVRLGATPEPLPETDAEASDESGDEDASYVPAIARLTQGVGVRA